MTPWVVLAALVAPAAFWVGYFYWHDRRKPEPLSRVALSYALGMAAGYACLRAYDLFPPAPVGPWLVRAGYSVAVVGGLEELAKLVPFIVVCSRLRAFDEEMDGIVYASAVALGFATVENLLYLDELAGAALWARAVASPLVHTVFSSIWGVLVARARVAGRSIWVPAAVGLVIAAVVHGLYDTLVVDDVVRPAAGAVILVAWIWRLRVKRRAAMVA